MTFLGHTVDWLYRKLGTPNGIATLDGNSKLTASQAYSPTGGGTNLVFFENDMTVDTNYTITTNKNALSAGPVTVANGITVTVPPGSVWTIV